MSLAWRNLWQSKTRFGLSVAAVSLAVALILLLNGLMDGVYRQVAQYPEHAPGSVVVAQEGVANLLAATSLLPPGTAESVRAVDGVSAVVPILSQFVILDLHGRKQPVYLVGYDARWGAGPWAIGDGRAPADDGEAVIDRVLARRHGLRVGDSFELQGRPFTITGLSRGATTTIGSFVFLRTGAVEAVLGARGVSSYLFVTPAPGTSAQTLAARLDALPGISALTKRQFVANDQAFIGDVFNKPLWLMVGIAFLVGTLVIGLVIYTATVERQREYGVLKAIGAGNGGLYLVVASQALIATLSGAIGAVALAFVGSTAFELLRPQFLVVIDPITIMRSLAIGLGIALLSALAPARVVAHLAPADVFRR